MDRLSNLPDNVLELILDGLPIVEKIRTSALSKNWRFKWTYLPSMNLDDNLFWSLKKKSTGSPPLLEYVNIINSLLMQHSGSLRNFILGIPCGSPSDKLSFDVLIQFVSRIHGLERLSVLNSGYHLYRLPCSVFSSVHLTHLKLHNCHFSLPPSFGGFPNLISLVLLNGTLAIDAVSCLVSSCPRLQVVDLNLYDGQGAHVNLIVPEVKNISISASFKTICLRNAENLEKVHINLYQLPTKEAGTSPEMFQLFHSSANIRKIKFSNYICELLTRGGALQKLPMFGQLKILHFNYVSFDDLESLRCVFRFCSCSPNLEELKLWAPYQDNRSPEVVGLSEFELIVQNYVSQNFDHLKRVDIRGFSGTTVEMKIIELFLGMSPILQEMFIELDDSVKEERALFIQMLSFCRKSETAKINYQ